MFNLKTDYALNKMDSAAIVYIDAEGNLTRLTREDFASLEEFLKWKAWSDANYHITEKAEHIHANHTLSLHGLSEAAAATLSPEAAEENRQTRRRHERMCAELVLQLRAYLTDTQFRRLWLYHVEGKTERQIARIEGVGQQRISKSIMAARRKAKKYFSARRKNRG